MADQGGSFERGYRLGKYEIVGRISVGGMAELYLAFLAGQGGFKKFVALKRVLPAAAEQESFLKMFLDEARITAALSHANIAQVYELAENPENREPVLAMEFVAGQNLGQVTRRARARQVPLPVAFSCRVMHDVLLGLHSAHHFVEPSSGRPMPVIHRDINPRNVMVTYTGGTKVIDFGIAKARGRLDTTQVGMVKGTLQYMSPEQVMLDTVDGRSDLFAASVVLWELLAGRRLFDEPSDAALLHRIVKVEVPSLREVAPDLPPGLAEVVMKGLVRDPAERWKSGREYARALDQAVPELFDDEQVAELMGRLFEDKIAFTRALLQSTTTEASYASLTRITQSSEDADSKPSLPPQPIVEVPTTPGRKKVDDAPRTTASETLVLDGPVTSPSTDRTEADLAPVSLAPKGPVPQAADEGPTSPDRPAVPLPAAPEEPRRQSTGTPAPRRLTQEGTPAPKRSTLDGQPAVKRPTLDGQPASKHEPVEGQPAARRPTVDGQPAAKRSTLDGQPAVKRPTTDGQPAARKPTAEAARAGEGDASTARLNQPLGERPPRPVPGHHGELLPVRRATSDAQELSAVAEATVTAAPKARRPWGLIIGVLLAVLVAAALVFVATRPAPEALRPLPEPSVRPAPPSRR